MLKTQWLFLRNSTGHPRITSVSFGLHNHHFEQAPDLCGGNDEPERRPLIEHDFGQGAFLAWRFCSVLRLISEEM